MNYIGKLYGKIGDIYFDTGKTTEDWDRLEQQVPISPEPPREELLEEAAWEGFKRCMRFFSVDEQDRQMRRVFEIWWKQLPSNHKLFIPPSVPTDEEITNKAVSIWRRTPISTNTHTWYENNPIGAGFIRGAIWMRDLLTKKEKNK